MVTTLLTLALLAQDPPPDAEPPAAAPEATAAEPSAPAAQPQATSKPRAADEVTQAVRKALALPENERPRAFAEVRSKYSDPAFSPYLPPSDFLLEPYLGLPPVDQVKATTRAWLTALLSGDYKAVVRQSGLPFLLEDRRIERAEELRSEWARVLKDRRLDLVALHDIEVFSAADLEKRYGKAPARLSRWDLHAPNTLFAVANLSGHGAVVMLRQSGVAWQVVAYHD